MLASFARMIAMVMLISGCAMVDNAPYQEPRVGENRVLTVWALSDIQPETAAEREVFSDAIDDVNTLGPVDMAIIAGDLLKSRSHEEGFDWFLQTRSRSKVENWFEIAGNHDMRSQPLFQHYFPNPPYYGIEIGNILFLMLSDTSKKSRTDITEDGFRWWQQMVMDNQDKIIVTVTHAQLADSGLFGSLAASRNIAQSERFEKILTDYKVDLWLSGHLHLPQGLAGTVAINKKFNNTCFVNVSSISKEFLIDSQSRFLLFTEGEQKMWLRSRNHTRQAFAPDLDIPLQLSKAFAWDGGPPRVILPENECVECPERSAD